MPIPEFIEEELATTRAAVEAAKVKLQAEREAERQRRARLAQRALRLELELARIAQWLGSDGRLVAGRLRDLGLCFVSLGVANAHATVVLECGEVRLVVRRRAGMFRLDERVINHPRELVECLGVPLTCELADAIDTGAIWEAVRDALKARRGDLDSGS